MLRCHRHPQTSSPIRRRRPRAPHVRPPPSLPPFLPPFLTLSPLSFLPLFSTLYLPSFPAFPPIPSICNFLSSRLLPPSPPPSLPQGPRHPSGGPSPGCRPGTARPRPCPEGLFYSVRRPPSLSPSIPLYLPPLPIHFPTQLNAAYLPLTLLPPSLPPSLLPALPRVRGRSWRPTRCMAG